MFSFKIFPKMAFRTSFTESIRGYPYKKHTYKTVLFIVGASSHFSYLKLTNKIDKLILLDYFSLSQKKLDMKSFPVNDYSPRRLLILKVISGN